MTLRSPVGLVTTIAKGWIAAPIAAMFFVRPAFMSGLRRIATLGDPKRATLTDH